MDKMQHPAEGGQYMKNIYLLGDDRYLSAYNWETAQNYG
jgi:hypothetical protein